jgi:hypothetical protein
MHKFMQSHNLNPESGYEVEEKIMILINELPERHAVGIFTILSNESLRSF